MCLMTGLRGRAYSAAGGRALELMRVGFAMLRGLAAVTPQDSSQVATTLFAPNARKRSTGQREQICGRKFEFQPAFPRADENHVETFGAGINKGS